MQATSEGYYQKGERGAVNSEVTIELSGGIEIISIITQTVCRAVAASHQARAVYAVIKASDVMIATFAILNPLGHSVEVRISLKERAPEKTYTRVMIG